MHVVTGKGGVGKSTVAAALALAAGARGARVLALELGEPGGLGRCLGVRLTAPGELVRADSGAHVGYVEGAAALGEYLLRRMHLGRLGRAIVAHPLYAAFVAAAPGLRELLTVGKVRDELVLQHRWDVVVVDAAASGHALEYLRMPAAAEATFARGRVHREAAVNAALLRDPARCAIHVVATPEDMPLREAVTTVTVLRDQALAVGHVIVNRCVPPAPPGVEALIAELASADLRAALARACTWAQIQARGVATLEAALDVTAVRLPRLPADTQATFLGALDALLDGIRARTGRARALLQGADAAFVLVAGPRPATLDDTTTLAAALRAHAAPLAAVVVNRLHPAPVIPTADAQLATLGWSPAAAWLRARWAELVDEAAAEDRVVEPFLRALPANIARGRIAEAAQDVHALRDLAAIAAQLGLPDARRARGMNRA